MLDLTMPCIEWQGPTRPDGYGEFIRYRERVRAHRHVWQECIGPLPDDVLLHHECHNKICVNPAHLSPLTRAEHNSEHGNDVTHCPMGHPYDEANTYRRKGKWKSRKCRTCHAKQQSERYHNG